MLAGFRVQAGVGKTESLDRLPVNDVRFDDLVDIGVGDVSIPDGLGVDHNRRPVLALIEAAGLVRADSSLQSALGELLLECSLQVGFSGGIAASPRIARWTLVPADEDVLFEFRHRNFGTAES